MYSQVTTFPGGVTTHLPDQQLSREERRVPDLGKCNAAEKALFYEVIEKTLSKSGVQFVFPQREVVDADGRKRKIDFAVITSHSRIAIELDGYNFHAEGVVSRQRFDDGLERQNELVLQDWTILRFSWDQVRTSPEGCRDALRRSVVGDADLHPVLASGPIEPHDIQKEALEAIENTRKAGNKRGLVVLATGLGKTYLSALDAKKFSGRILFIVHNNLILSSAQSAYRKIMPDRNFGTLNSLEKDFGADVLFANIATLRNQTILEEFARDAFDYIVVDEFHHGATQHYRRVINYFEPKFLLGMTATPNRTDGRSILSIVDDNLIYESSLCDAIEKGFLVPFKYHGLRDNVDYSNIRHNGFRYDISDLNKALIVEQRDEAIVNHYKKLVGDGSAIGFCVSIEHAIRSADFFSQKGIPSYAIHSQMNPGEKERVENGFRNGEIKVVFACDIFNEGVDFPDVSAVLFLRPTESKILFYQQLGRGLRLSSSKKNIKVLDFITNYINADKVFEYLSDCGAQCEFRELREKPQIYFETGCEVLFETKAIDIISILRGRQIDQGRLIKSFFELCGKLQRTPFPAEIQSRSEFNIADFISHYGTWQGFIDRIKSLDPDFDTKNLQLSYLPEQAGDNVLDVLAEDQSLFRQSIEDAESAIEEFVRYFLSIRIRNEGDLYEALSKLTNRIESIVDKSAVVTNILGVRFTAKACREEASTNAEWEMQVAYFQKKIGRITELRESSILCSLFRELGKDLYKIKDLMRVIHSEQDSNTKHCENLLSWGMKGISRLLSANDNIMQIIDYLDD